MSALNWIGTGASFVGKFATGKTQADAKTFAQRFQGTFGVTIGNAISGNYGTTLQSYYGPYITHLVDTGGLGLKMLGGQYLNPINPFDATLSGIGGYVTWVYGANITVNYGGPAGTVNRAQSFSKTAFAADKQVVPLGIGTQAYLADGKTPLTIAPKGKEPEGVSGQEMATADKGTLLAVNLLSILLNVTVATLELAAKFKYTSYDPNDHLPANLPDPAAVDYPDPLYGINLALSIIPVRIMGLIYSLEMAGTWELWGQGWVQGAKDLAIDVITLGGIEKNEKAKLKKAGISGEDAIGVFISMALLIGMILGLTAAILAEG